MVNRLVIANVILLRLRLAYRNARTLRPLAYFFTGVMFSTGWGTRSSRAGSHRAFRSVPSTSSGFYSSPFLLYFVYLFLRLRASRRATTD